MLSFVIGFKGHHRVGLKSSLKRNLSPEDAAEGSCCKQVKINMYTDPLKAKSEEWTSSSKSPSVTSNLGNSLDTSDLQHQFSQIKFDSGIDLHTDISSLSETAGSLDRSCSSSISRRGLPRPRLYHGTRSRGCASESGERTPSSDGDASCEKSLMPLNENSPSGVGLQDILASIEKDLSTPMRRLLQTPPKSADKSLLTSTPFRGVFGSPEDLPVFR